MPFIERLKQPFTLALLFLLVYLSPNIFFADHARYLIHDNINSNVVWYKILSDSGMLFASNNSIVPNVLWGIPRGVLPSELNVNVLLYSFLSPLTAYNLNIILIHFIAFTGMYKLLTSYVFKNTYPIHAAFLSLSFAILPFWPGGELSVAGQPFLIWAFLNILNKKYGFKNWFIICFFPFYSDLIFSNLFIACGLFVFILVFFIMYKQVNYKAILAWFLFLVFMLIPEYRLFYMQFVEHLTSNRAADFDFLLNIKGVIGMSFLLFLKGQYHFYSLQWPILVFASLLSLFFIKEPKQKLLLVLFLLGAFICAFIDTAHKSKDLEPLLNKFGELKYLQFRFTSMIPMLWYMAFAFAIYFILLRYNKLKMFALGLIIANVLFTACNINSADSSGSVFTENAFYSTYINPADDGHCTFNAYYNPALFNEVKKRINYKNETLICIGFQSEIAQYSNIYTGASAFSYLPQDKNNETSRLFQPGVNNQHRAFSYTPESIDKIKAFEADTTMARKKPIAYLLSDLPITNYQQAGFDSIGYIANPVAGSIGGIYLFKIKHTTF
jgi:hypothetical protein